MTHPKTSETSEGSPADSGSAWGKNLLNRNISNLVWIRMRKRWWKRQMQIITYWNEWTTYVNENESDEVNEHNRNLLQNDSLM